MNEINEWTVPHETEDRPDDVIFAILRLSRALRRCAPEQRANAVPPAVGRLLACVGKNSGVSSRELCKLLDLRPSSLSEMLSCGESAGLLTRVADENDRRIQHIFLSEKGQEIYGRINAERMDAYRKKISCFTEEEARQFCELSSRLASHLEFSAAGRSSADEKLIGQEIRPSGDPESGCPPSGDHSGFPSSPRPCHAPEMPQSAETEELKKHKIFPENARFRS